MVKGHKQYFEYKHIVFAPIRFIHWMKRIHL